MNGSGEFGILDKQIDVLRTGGILPEKDIISLCTKVGCILGILCVAGYKRAARRRPALRNCGEDGCA